MTFFEELKRRNVIRLALAYLAASWLLIEISSSILGIYNAPQWISRVIVALLAVGFPLALFFAWAFEITPEGIKRESQVDRSKSISHHTAKRLDLITIAMLVLVAALFVGQRFLLPAPVAEPAAPVANDGGPSVAVLPFVNMSDDASNEYFSEGVSEEILNVLAQLPDLRVAARTSAFQFKGHDEDISDIARKLNVGNVLEGSVRKQGQHVRITAQLIDAASGFHLWSETYDRELTDIFMIQDEIAASIADALKVKFDIGKEAEKQQTGNLEAYDLYLQGVHHWRLRTGNDLLQAIDAFEAAKRIDPSYVKAYIGLAMVYSVIASYTTFDPHQSLTRARDNAEMGLALDPGSARVFAVLGLAATQEDRMATGIALLKRAVALDTQDSTARLWLGLGYARSGDLDAGIEQLAATVAIDPAYGVASNRLSYAYLMAGKLDDADAELERLRDIAPQDSLIPISDLEIAWLRQQPARLAAALQALAAQKGTPEARGFAGQLIEALAGTAPMAPVAERLAAFNLFSSSDPASANMVWEPDTVWLLEALGRRDLALGRLEQLQASAWPDLRWAYGELFAPLRCAPRFRKVMTDFGFADKVAGWRCPP